MTADAVDPSSSVDLTEETITAAMAKADAQVCVGSHRCFALPYRLEDALASCSAQRAPEVAVQGRGYPKGHRQQRRSRKPRRLA